eukprot:gnl/MRDRNA2_/MRDRNA2_73067_c0_seq2.p1 gnl/MRDRNA2_/MRDRNA2_73067_c0~~gnl/MRDRNA2_/MRDRNA2_73067_c0_seq2.p1  ORF type:complete len:416 (-),score=76.51 gnl/MRDRNA2_/MRDRNA2_73067_c0_seq2:98-1345(-)
MLSILVLPLIILQVHAKGVSVSHLDSPQGSAVSSVDNLLDNLVDKLFERSLQAWPLYSALLDRATLDKPGQLAMPTSRLSPVAAFSRPGVSTSYFSPHVSLQARYRSIPSPSKTVPNALPSTLGIVSGYRSRHSSVAVRAADTLEGLSLKDETVYSKDDPFRASFVSMEAISTTEAGTTYTIVLSTENADQAPFRFLEGQVLTVYVNYKEPEEKPNMMFLSIASSRYGDSQDGKSLSLCVFVKAGRDNYFGSLAAGDPVMLTGPIGKNMLLPSDLTKDLVGISVGTGIAPYRGFAKRLFVDDSPAKASFTGKMKVITAADSAADLVYADEFSSIASSSGGKFVYDSYTGETILQAIDKNGGTITDCLKGGGHVYIAGPLKGIMDEVVTALKKSSPDAEELIAAAKADGRWDASVY